LQDFPMHSEQDQQTEFVIQTFTELPTHRPFSEYCKPFMLETLALDFDDVCA
jgi:hypothetical protein